MTGKLVIGVLLLTLFSGLLGCANENSTLVLTTIPTATTATRSTETVTHPIETNTPLPTLVPTLSIATPTFRPRPTITPAPSPTSIILRATPVAGSFCPSNIQVNQVAPGLDPSGFEWSAAILPMGDPCVNQIVVDPRDDRVWYVAGQKGIYITHDGGTTWELALAPNTTFSTYIALDAVDPNIVYAGNKTQVFVSTDRGRNWKTSGNFPAETYVFTIQPMRDGTVYLGLNWGRSNTPNGVWVSRDRGATWQLLTFEPLRKGLVVHTIAQDPRDGTLYAGVEIFDHPQPYKPPFLRSSDAGKTWVDISGKTITWHVIEIQIDVKRGYVFAMTEGAGLYGSADRGENWKRLGGDFGLTLSLDSNNPRQLFGGKVQLRNLTGGAFWSTDAGTTFTPIGLNGVSVSSFSQNASGTMLYAAAYASGIYISKIPSAPSR